MKKIAGKRLPNGNPGHKPRRSKNDRQARHDFSQPMISSTNLMHVSSSSKR